MKVLYFMIFLSLVACSRKENNYYSRSLGHMNDSVSLTENVVCQSIIRFNDSVLTERYQTFDEYTMSGKGRPVHSPFVYVKRHKDSILVLSSNRKDSVRLYVKLNYNIWYSHMEYDMWKKEHYIPSKDKLSKTARTYDRYFYNDTILEVKTCYITGKQYHQIYIKTNCNLYIIRNVEHLNFSVFSDLRRMVNNLILSNDRRVNKYVLIEKNKRYTYEGRNNKDTYSYERKAYGIWGIQPGIEEANLYEGVDIREFSDNLNRYQHDNSDIIYEAADEVPVFPGGTSRFYEFIRNNISDSLKLDKRPYRVILEVVIEKDGRIINAGVKSSIDSIHDNEALYIIKKMPRWVPAKLNGNFVRYKMLIPISYK
ncbi:energy transducer TonB [Prevotella sp. P6B4]|uniref:energy transducer TonB n=1 Tax=Prevotella sp. P6B4 TaxID=1410614 RepID=UPI0009DD5000|nr:energy transducer TonB [Prevotella sp. P6B4]